MARQVAFLRWRILFLSHNVLDIIRYVTLFYVVHVIHWLLKYVTSIMINTAKFEEYSLFNPVLRKIHGIWSFAVWHDVDKYLVPRNNPLFFKKESAIFIFVIHRDHATFTLKYPDGVYFSIFASILSNVSVTSHKTRRTKVFTKRRKG